MQLQTLRFIALLFTALTLAPSLAHVLELTNKMSLSRENYLVVQQIYRGWALLGIVVFGALLANLWLTLKVRRQRRVFLLCLLALLGIAITQWIFWTWTYPANRATNNWTVLPDNWEALRYQWEYSHAASALCNLLAFMSLTLSVLVQGQRTVS